MNYGMYFSDELQKSAGAKDVLYNLLKKTVRSGAGKTVIASKPFQMAGQGISMVGDGIERVGSRIGGLGGWMQDTNKYFNRPTFPISRTAIWDNPAERARLSQQMWLASRGERMIPRAPLNYSSFDNMYNLTKMVPLL